MTSDDRKPVDLDGAKRKAKAALDLRAAFDAQEYGANSDTFVIALASWPHVLAELVNAMADELAQARARLGELEEGFKRQADYAMRLSAHVKPSVVAEIRKRSFPAESKAGGGVMSKVYKYKLKETRTGIEMPEGAQVLHVGEQGWGCYLWALVDPTKPTVERRFFIVGTGADFDCNTSVHHGTIQAQNGLVWHVFEEAQP